MNRHSATLPVSLYSCTLPKHVAFLNWTRPVMVCLGGLSAVVLCIAMHLGFHWGLAFKGGSLLTFKLYQPVSIGKIRTLLVQSGFSRATVQHYGSAEEILIRLPPSSIMNQSTLARDILNLIRKDLDEEVSLIQEESVGPSTGNQLLWTGCLATALALLITWIYITLRFEWRLATGAILALLYDLLITVSGIALFGLDIDTAVIAAILSVVSYSLNDTIVVFDRMRENFLRFPKVAETTVINISLTQTLRRTVITSGTTFVVMLTLFSLGGSILKGFSAVLLIGIAVGPISTIYIATTCALTLGLKRIHLSPLKT